MKASPIRYVWILLGLMCVALGFVGFITPGLPGTVFFVLAMWFFSKSSERFLQWLLRLPIAGPALQDYKAGLGMPIKAKYVTLITMSIAVIMSMIYLHQWYIRSLLASLWLVGMWYVWFIVPTRERVLAQRSQQA